MLSSRGHGWLLPPPLSSWSLRLAALSSWMAVAPCLTVKPHPDWSLVTELSVCTMSMRLCSFLFSWMRSLKSYSVLPAGPLDSAFTSFLAGVSHSHRDTRIGLGTFSTPWFAWALQLAYLRYWVLCLTHSRLDLSQSASLYVFHSLVEWIRGILNNTEVCFNVLHFLPHFHRWEVQHEPHGLNGCVLGGSQYDSHCLVLHSFQL